jgi:hypothetical protein
MAWALGVGELLVLAVAFLVMFVGLKVNGQVFTEMLPKTRRFTWEVGSVTSLAVTCGVFVVFLARSLVTRRGLLLLLTQAVLVAIVIGVVVWFRGALPVPPPGQHSGGFDF